MSETLPFLPLVCRALRVQITTHFQFRTACLLHTPGHALVQPIVLQKDDKLIPIQNAQVVDHRADVQLLSRAPVNNVAKPREKQSLRTFVIGGLGARCGNSLLRQWMHFRHQLSQTTPPACPAPLGSAAIVSRHDGPNDSLCDSLVVKRQWQFTGTNPPLNFSAAGISLAPEPQPHLPAYGTQTCQGDCQSRVVYPTA